MSINLNVDYSTLFGSLSSGSTSSSDYVSSLSSLVSDYNSIKNGSYGKVVSAYYAKAAGKTSSTSTASSTASSSTSRTTSATEYASVAKNAQSLETSVEALSSKSLYNKKNITTTASDGTKTTSYGYDTDSLYKAASDFVDKYNSLLSSGSSSTGTNIASRTAYMKTTTNQYANALSDIGITKDDTTGKLSIDETAFKKADVSKIQSLFSTDSGYGYQVSTAASLVESAATSAVSSSSGSTYTSSGTYTAYSTGTLLNSLV